MVQNKKSATAAAAPTAPSSATFSYSTSRIDRRDVALNQRLDLQAVAQLITKGYHKFAGRQYDAIQTAARGWYESGDTRALSNLDALKKGLAWLQPAGYNKYGHATNGLIPNGFVQIDIDFHFQGGNLAAAELKEQLKTADAPFMALCSLSPTGYGLKIFVKTDIAPDAMTERLYKFAQTTLIHYFSKTFGIDAHCFDRFGIAQTCFIPYDPSVIVNYNATAFAIDVAAFADLTAKQAEKAKNKQHKSTFQATDTALHQAIKYLLDQKINVGSCYSDYLVFTTACKNALNNSNAQWDTIAYAILSNSEQFQVSKFKTNFDKLVKTITNKEINSNYILTVARKNGFEYHALATPVAADLAAQNFNNLDVFIAERSKTLEYIKEDTGKKIIVCENSALESIQTADNTTVCGYSDLSKVKTTIGKNTTVYVLGSQNLGRKYYINAANEVEKVAQHAKTILFADTPIYLNIARNITTIDRSTPNMNVLVSDKPRATFVETLRKYATDAVLYCETSESINKQLKNYTMVKRSELYAADHNKTLVVLYDKNVQLLPDAFTQFKNVVLVVSAEKKACTSMSDFCTANDKQTNDALALLDNNVMGSQIEKLFYEAVKNRTIAIRLNTALHKWERCPNTEGVMENEHLINTLVADAEGLKQYLNKRGILTEQAAEVSEAAEAIELEIEEAKKDLAAEKKKEYFDFLDAVATDAIASQAELKDYVAQQETMSRGAKIAYNRLQILSKVNPSFATCFEAVHAAYNRWTQTKGRFLAAKVIKNKTKMGIALSGFKTATDGNRYTKGELLDLAKTMLPMLNENDKEVWKGLKRLCFVTSKAGRREGKVMKLYEVHFLE